MRFLADTCKTGSKVGRGEERVQCDFLEVKYLFFKVFGTVVERDRCSTNGS